MTAALTEKKQDRIRKLFLADDTLSYRQLAERNGCTERQVRYAVKDLPRVGFRAQLAKQQRGGR